MTTGDQYRSGVLDIGNGTHVLAGNLPHYHYLTYGEPAMWWYDDNADLARMDAENAGFAGNSLPKPAMELNLWYCNYCGGANDPLDENDRPCIRCEHCNAPRQIKPEKNLGLSQEDIECIRSVWDAIPDNMESAWRPPRPEVISATTIVDAQKSIGETLKPVVGRILSILQRKEGSTDKVMK